MSSAIRVCVTAPVTWTWPDRPASIAYVPLPFPVASMTRTRLAPAIEKFSAHVPASIGEGDVGLLHADPSSASMAMNRRILAVCHRRESPTRLSLCCSSFRVGAVCGIWVITSIERQVDAFAFFERLEVAELVDAPEAVLQRVGVEDGALQKVHIPANDAVVRRRVADERDTVHEILPALLQPHG